MNLWLLGALLLLGALFFAGVVCWRCSNYLAGIVAMEMASTITILVVVLLAQGWGRSSWYDLALALALLNFPSAMVFLVFLERWM